MQIKRLVARTFGPPASLVQVVEELAPPQDHEVTVKVHAAGLGFVDGLMIQGLYQVKPPLPYYPGNEFCGVVVAAGPNAGVAEGTRVLGMAGSGAMADAVNVPGARVIPIAANSPLDDATAAGLFINYATALYGLRDCGQAQPGEKILILGAAGGVGSAAIAVAKAMGLEVIAAASSDAKRKAALNFGADHTLDYSNPDWRSTFKADFSTVDLVYDPVGGDLADPAFRCLAPRGRFLVVGFASGTIPKLALNLALLKRASVVGVDWGGEARANPGINTELLATLLEWIDSGKLVPAQVMTQPMSNYVAAFEQQLAGEVIGKMVLLNDA